jgi:hypothetical protein
MAAACTYAPFILNAKPESRGTILSILKSSSKIAKIEVELRKLLPNSSQIVFTPNNSPDRKHSKAAQSNPAPAAPAAPVPAPLVPFFTTVYAPAVSAPTVSVSAAVSVFAPAPAPAPVTVAAPTSSFVEADLVIGGCILRDLDNSFEEQHIDLSGLSFVHAHASAPLHLYDSFMNQDKQMKVDDSSANTVDQGTLKYLSNDWI